MLSKNIVRYNKEATYFGPKPDGPYGAKYPDRRTSGLSDSITLFNENAVFIVTHRLLPRRSIIRHDYFAP